MEHILILNACCIICQKLKVVEVEEVQEDSDLESESDADPYGSLDGGSPRNFSGDEVDRKGKEGKKMVMMKTMILKTMTLNHNHQILISNPQRELGSPV
jgi:hypothetical protein